MVVVVVVEASCCSSTPTPPPTAINPPSPQPDQHQPPNQRLWETREVLHACMVNPHLSVRQSLTEADCFIDKGELFTPLKLMYDSLVATGGFLGGFWQV